MHNNIYSFWHERAWRTNAQKQNNFPYGILVEKRTPLVPVATATIQTVLGDIGTFGPNTFFS